MSKTKTPQRTVYRNDKTGRFISEAKYLRSDQAKVTKEKVPVPAKK